MTGIYVRQSVDRKESVSIEAQIEFCKNELRGDTFRIYDDRGFSGKNTNRPAFKKLMEDVEKGAVSRIIVYRLDRFSRNIADFAGTYDIISRHGVELVSYTERFDTSSAIGKAMLAIVMVFAQMERETIVERVKDNYYKRGELGLFVGGPFHYGFEKEAVTHNGMKTKRLTEIPAEAKNVRQMYEKYASGISKPDILEWFSKVSSTNKTVMFIGQILRNPIYVKSNLAVINYLENRGAKQVNADGRRDGAGIFIYGIQKRTSVLYQDLTGGLLQIAIHDGFIPAELWLKVQKRFDSEYSPRNLGKGKRSWVVGLAVCAYCKLHVYTANKYGWLSCGGRKKKLCKLRKPFPKMSTVEEQVEKSLLEFMKDFPFKLNITKKENESRIQALEAEISAIGRQIDMIVETIVCTESGLKASAMQKFKQKLEALTDKSAELEREVYDLRQAGDNTYDSDIKLAEYVSNWQNFSMEEKNRIAKIFIKQVVLRDGEIEIKFII